MKPEKSFENIVMDYELGFENFLPKRLEVLAEGFAKKLTSKQVNEKLLTYDCETLYARSYFEASLIYAFDHGIDYKSWRELFEKCRKIYDENKCRESIFSGGKITLKQLEAYVMKGSGNNLKTKFLTSYMESQLKESGDEANFETFMQENAGNFSESREKARYYFCKYLFFYIREKSEAYYHSCELSEKLREQYGNLMLEGERGMQEKFALEELTFLKPLTKLKKEADKAKPGMSVEEKREYLENASLTPGGIFDEFNYFYFGYVSADWIEILFELYGEIEDWPYQDKLRIAVSLGLCNVKSDKQEEKKAVEKLECMAFEQRKKEEMADLEHVRDKSMKKKIYQRGRSGEDYFRDFILGKKDINRSTLIAFLLFVNEKIHTDADSKVTIPRLNRILLHCGFPQLRPNNAFDQFVIRFLRASDPMEVVEEEVEQQVTRGNDFYLYRVYKDAYCHRDELIKYLNP